MRQLLLALLIMPSAVAATVPLKAEFEANRRQFLRCALGLTAGSLITTEAALTLDHVTRDPHAAELNTRYTKTILEGALLQFGAELLAHAFPHHVGNASIDTADLRRQILFEPALLVARANFASPVIEELAWRFFPAVVFGTDWTVGLVQAGLFAGLHNVRGGGFDLTKIPAGQFATGLFYWYLAREKGIDHAILAHGANNWAKLVMESLLIRYP